LRDLLSLGAGSAYAVLKASVHACGFVTVRNASRCARLYHHRLPPPRGLCAPLTLNPQKFYHKVEQVKKVEERKYHLTLLFFNFSGLAVKISFACYNTV
jgi:hypothetical protein